MANKRKIKIFSAGCPVCVEAIDLVNQITCPSCDVSVLDMKEPDVSNKAKNLGIRSVPAVVIDGKVANCCSGRGVDETVLRSAGVGQRI